MAHQLCVRFLKSDVYFIVVFKYSTNVKSIKSNKFIGLAHKLSKIKSNNEKVTSVYTGIRKKLMFKIKLGNL